MQQATIVPTAFLSSIKGKPYHMALAHLVGVDQKYTEFYRQEALDGSFILMDNGVFENEQQTIADIVSKARLIGANEIILPDVFLDMLETIKSTSDSLAYIKKYAPDLAVMAVPQGNTLDEWLACASVLIHLDINSIGVPKKLTSIGGRDARQYVIRRLQEHFPERLAEVEIHLLGCYETPLECRQIARACANHQLYDVRGCDSALAYVYAREAMLITDGPRPAGAVAFDSVQCNVDCLNKNIEIWEDAVVVGKDNVTRVWF